MSTRYIELMKDNLDGLRVYSVMAYPDSERERNEFMACNVAGMMLNANDTAADDDISIPESILRVILNAPSLEVVRNCHAESGRQGSIAGDVLACLAGMHASGVKEPSIRKAIYIEMYFLGKGLCRDGKTVGTTDPSIRNCWEKYKSVSHFWAAFRVCQFGENEDGFPDVKTALVDENLAKFLSIAEWFRAFGENFIPKRQTEPVLPLDAWRVPESYPIQPANLTHDGLPEWVMARLGAYRKRQFD